MTPKVEYWSIGDDEFIELKNQLNTLAEKSLGNLTELNFSKLESQVTWLGYTIKKTENNILTFISFALEAENPRKFLLLLRRWNNENPRETCEDLYSKEFNSINEYEEHYTIEMNKIKEILYSSRS